MMPPDHFVGDDVDADAADARGRPREVLVDERLVEADGFEDLRAAVALQRRDAHLGHHLQDALVERVDVVLDRLRVRHADEQLLPDHVVERFEREVRVDRAGAVAEQQRAVVHFARVAGFEHEAAARARALPHEMMVHAGRRQQARNRRALAIGAAVREDEDRVARFHGGAGLPLQLVHRVLEARAALPRVEQHRERDRLEPRLVHVAQLRQLRVVDDRVLDADLAARLRPRIEQVALRPDGRPHRRHQLLADGVERRIGDLREALAEVVVQQARAVRQHRERRVGAHRADGFFAVGRHGREQQPQIFLRVAERLLPLA